MTGRVLRAKVMTREGRVKLGQAGVYIGRAFPGLVPSVLANPFPVKGYGRERAIELYRGWLRTAVNRKSPAILQALGKLRDQLRAGEDITLLCWCPDNLPCHGDVIAEAITTWGF